MMSIEDRAAEALVVHEAEEALMLEAELRLYALAQTRRPQPDVEPIIRERVEAWRAEVQLTRKELGEVTMVHEEYRPPRMSPAEGDIPKVVPEFWVIALNWKIKGRPYTATCLIVSSWNRASAGLC
jgi:hypothetical protein